MDTVGETSFATPGDIPLEITRTFDAPRQKVFDAFSVCEAAHATRVLTNETLVVPVRLADER
jgi:hypothetical protein